MLYLRGSQYKLDKQVREARPESIELYKNDIREKVVTHLSKCPTGLVVMDETELPCRHVMAVFEELLTSPSLEWKGKMCRLDRATFLFLSDFGVEDFTKDMSAHDLQMWIDADSRYLWKSAKIVTLMHHLVPFVTMPKPTREQLENPVPLYPPYAVRKLCELLLAELLEVVEYPAQWRRYDVTVRQLIPSSDDTTTDLATVVYNEAVYSEVYRGRNYRGIEQLFRLIMSDALYNALRKYWWSDRPTFRSVVGRIAVDADNNIDIVFTPE